VFRMDSNIRATFRECAQQRRQKQRPGLWSLLSSGDAARTQFIFWIPGQRPIRSLDLRGGANPDERARWRRVERWSALCTPRTGHDMALCACIPLWTLPSCLYYSWPGLARRYSPGGRSSLPCRRAPEHATWVLDAGCDMPQCSAVTAEQIQLLRFGPRVIVCSGHDTRTPRPRSEGERATGCRVRRGLQISSPREPASKGTGSRGGWAALRFAR